MAGHGTGDRLTSDRKIATGVTERATARMLSDMKLGVGKYRRDDLLTAAPIVFNSE